MPRSSNSALMKAFGRGGAGLFPAQLIMADELTQHFGCELVGVAGGVREQYFAIVPRRRSEPAAIRQLVGAAAASLGDSVRAD